MPTLANTKLEVSYRLFDVRNILQISFLEGNQATINNASCAGAGSKGLFRVISMNVRELFNWIFVACNDFFVS